MKTNIGMVWAGLLTTVMLTGCLVSGRHSEAVLFAPPLPPLVVLESEPYYVHQGYHYNYRNDHWYYSRSRNGPWSSLPRDRYPRETRYRKGPPGRDDHRGPGHKR